MIYTLGGKKVETADDDYFVAPSAQVIGLVRLGSRASVWFNCVLRGDSDWIVLGDGTNVQDGSVIHTDEGAPTVLGRNVTVGHVAFLHSCTIGDETMIANGARVLDRVKIGSRCIIAAGALIPPDKEIPDGSVVMGAPGKIVREVTERDLAMIARAAEHYQARTREYRALLKVDERS
jgi:carbonic anhydrase/acetyltransferase-like protein (isoleucine patch superfamily)